MIAGRLEMDQIIPREIESAMSARLREDDRALILFGARRVGKTTLARRLVEVHGGRCLELSGDEVPVVDALSSRDGERLRGLVRGYDLMFLDEAQRIPDIGLGLKILHDTLPGFRMIVTGSSALDLASKTREALTGRAWTFRLGPFSQKELLDSEGAWELGRRLDRDLVYGTYPESRKLGGDAERAAFLRELHASYLFKDIFELGGIRQPRKIVDLLRLLAMQVGSEVSLTELGSLLRMSKDTVSSYLDLLEKSFIVFRLPAFSRNIRNEVARSTKVYFF
ncbi:MAG: ATP-binding protein, partial [Spirochaetia bacterium]|nr:ATP-binding protein [Spirochaetia bacterium]